MVSKVVLNIFGRKGLQARMLDIAMECHGSKLITFYFSKHPIPKSGCFLVVKSPFFVVNYTVQGMQTKSEAICKCPNIG